MPEITCVFESHLGEFKEALESQVEQALIAVGLSAETYAKEGCPVDTGRLRNSISHEVEGRSVVIGTGVVYGKWVELGHHQKVGRYVPKLGKSLVKDYVAGHPFLGPAAEGHTEEYKGIVEQALRS